ncbi:hypothetical protein [Chryseobacterium oryctis]|uniref:Virus attachment protein p12 family protein n=1 Tax=Chryseobacterium oryctis TaxID=2952618 RepID=A0ABT3HQI6_9FLAO|nr:hypothetical protein [Chryseobacterium oryctis]MCW3162046.1 hypothetical protein [Chryseobacterium oryctis]
MLTNILNYIRENWLLCLLGGLFLSWFVYLTYEGNQVCDCEKTETYRDGTTRSHSSGRGFYRYYHK